MKRYLNRDFGVCLLLSAAVLAVYWQVWNFDFINLDDPVYVTNNRHVQAGLSRESVVWAFTTTHAGFRIPLTWLSLMLDFELYGLNAGGYHLTNLLLHIANALFLFFLLKRMSGALGRSCFVAALFALHPLHVESVAWVTERKDVLSTLFWMLTMWGYLRYLDRPGVKRYLVIIVTFTLGLMAKPMLVTLPFVLILLDYWPLGRFQVGQLNGALSTSIQPPLGTRKVTSQTLRLIWEKAPLFALAAAWSVVVFLTKKSVGAVAHLDTWPIKTRIANALVSYVKYMGKMFWPRDLAVLYPHPGGSLPIWQAAAAGLLLLSVSIVLLRLAKNHPYLAVGWLWYLGTLVPVIGFVQVGAQAMADRFTYVPLIGLYVIIAWGLFNVIAKVSHRGTLLVTGAGVLFTALMICTWRQVRLWQDSIILFEHTLSVTSNNSSIHNNLGNALRDLGKVDEAIVHYTEALEIRPNHVRAHNNLGLALAQKGRLHEAVSHHSQAIRLDPGYAKAYYSLGVNLALQRKIDEAIAYFSRALELDPDYVDAHTGLGSALVLQGRLEEAMAHFSKALEIRPDHAGTHYNLGIALIRKHKLDEAIAHLTQAVKTKPTYAKAHMSLGTVLAAVGRLNEAASHLQEVIRLKTNDAEVHNILGVVLARQGKFEEAIVHFSEAVKIDPSHASARQNLKKALPSVNKFPEESTSSALP